VDFEFADCIVGPGEFGEIIGVINSDYFLIVTGIVEGDITPYDLAGFDVDFDSDCKLLVFFN